MYHTYGSEDLAYVGLCRNKYPNVSPVTLTSYSISACHHQRGENIRSGVSRSMA